MFNNLKPTVLAVLLAILAMLGLKYCDHKQIKSITDTNLKPTEQVGIIVDPRKGTITTIRRDRKNKKETTITQKQTSGARDIRIGISPEGRAVVTFRTHGFLREPGFIGAYGKPGLRLGGDMQLYFWNNWGINVGVTTTTNFDVKPFVGVSYTLDKLELTNTSVVVGVDTRREILAGIRVRL